MRITKHRGKREDNGEWVYGAFYPIKDELVCFIINNCQSINFDDNSTFFNGYKVHKKSVGQFTGLHDKNGKEIYEDDIIEYIQHHFNTEMTLIKRKIVNWKYDRWNIYETNAGESDIKIIGNTHENPELL